MKKSTFLAVAAVVLAFYVVSAIGNRDRLYEKKETYRKPEEAIVNFIGHINSYENLKSDNGYYRIPSREFLESISKRYRLYIGEESTYKYMMEQIPSFISYELKEVDYNSLNNIKSNYEESFKNISNYSRDINPMVYKLDGYGIYLGDVEKSYINEDGTVNNTYNDEEFPFTLYLVLVDEGEGYVVDYYSVIYQ
ncbi:MAG: hypothetical protein E7212_14460 [Clostridium sartagoforme]|nr:hypothetical protein [Clostridium sartagoforme]